MKKLMILVGLAVSAVLPATATADKVHNVVSIHADQYHCCTEEIYGSVESAKTKCERNRTIRLFHRPFGSMKRGGDGFQVIDSTTTDGQGEYSFEGTIEKRGGSFDSGEYFARATKATRGNDVCVFDDSRVIALSGSYLP